MNWLEVYRSAKSNGMPLAGYYHRNIKTRAGDRDVIVRIPIHGADEMDLRLWTEPEILTAIGPHVPNAPKLLHSENDPPYQVHEFIDGPVLNDVSPRGTAVPDHVLTDVVQLFAGLAAITLSELPALPEGWPVDCDTAGFARKIAGDSRRVFERNRTAHAGLYKLLGIPADPFEATDAAWGDLAERPLTCLHSDIHRKNVIVHGGRCYFLDWELALYGDPVYELAVHVHKTAYLPHEYARLIELWRSALSAEATAGYEPALNAYLTHEQIKSTLVDSVRYAQAFAGAPAPYPHEELITKLTAMLTTARGHWGITETVERDHVGDILRTYSKP